MMRITSKNALSMAGALVAGLLASVHAAFPIQRNLFESTAFRVWLTCQVQNEKVLAITNTSGATISAGTRITYDAIRKPDQAHYGRTISTAGMTPGGVLQIGAVPSFSCTAWFVRLPVMAPLQN